MSNFLGVKDRILKNFKLFKNALKLFENIWKWKSEKRQNLLNFVGWLFKLDKHFGAYKSGKVDKQNGIEGVLLLIAYKAYCLMMALETAMRRSSKVLEKLCGTNWIRLCGQSGWYKDYHKVCFTLTTSMKNWLKF